MRSIVVSPSATSAAITRPADARRSVAITVAPDSRGTPLTIAVLPSISIDAPRRLELLHVHEAVLEDRLGDAVGAVRDAVERHELRLHVGRERRVLRRADVRADQRVAVRAHADRVVVAVERDAGLAQLVEHRVERARSRAARRRPRRRAATPSPRPRRGTCRSRCGPASPRDARRAASRRLRSTMRSVPAPVIRAPIATSTSARSTTSGSRAAFSIVVVPSASVAAIIRFSVPVTVTMSVTMRAPLQPRAFARCAPRGSPARSRSTRPSPAGP